MLTIKVTDQLTTQDNEGNDVVRVRASIYDNGKEVQKLSFDHKTTVQPEEIVEELKKTLENHVLEEENRKKGAEVERTLKAVENLEIEYKDNATNE